MVKNHIKCSIACVVIAVNILVLVGDGYAAGPSVRLVINPENTEVYAGTGKIVITADAPGKDLTFTWKLEGPGKLEGEGAAVSYTPPKKSEKDSVQAAVTVVVKDKAGEEAKKSVMFTILPRPASGPIPSEQEGSGKGKTVALSLGAAAAVGAGVALLVGGGSNGDGFDGDSNGDGSDCVTSCAGVSVGCYCWYLGAQGESCTQVCAIHGGYHEATHTYVGLRGGGWPNCESVARTLGASWDISGGVRDEGLGCHINYGSYMSAYPDKVWLALDWTTHPDASESKVARVCACNR